MNYDELPARARTVVDQVRGGKKLCVSHRVKESGDTEVVCFYEPGGKNAPPKSSLAAIESGLLKPLGDGLFGDETSQTWVA